MLVFALVTASVREKWSVRPQYRPQLAVYRSAPPPAKAQLTCTRHAQPLQWLGSAQRRWRGTGGALSV